MYPHFALGFSCFLGPKFVQEDLIDRFLHVEWTGPSELGCVLEGANDRSQTCPSRDVRGGDIGGDLLLKLFGRDGES